MPRILLVDDSETARKIMARVLGDSYELSFATGGREALERIVSDSPDLVILDLLMPEMNGFEVLEELSARGIRIPVLVFSADIQKSTRDRVLALGAAGMANKPPRPEELREAVRKVLAGERP